MSDGNGSADREEDEDPIESIAAGLGVVVMGLLAVVLLTFDVEWWWVAFVIGGGLIPLMYGLAEWYSEGEGTGVGERGRTEQQDALDELRSRYARDELSDAEFERRLERLVETETVEDARRVVERRARERAANEGERFEERDLERERE